MLTQSRLKLTYIALSLLLMSLLQGCGAEKQSTFALSSVDDENPTVGEVNEEYFYIRVFKKPTVSMDYTFSTFEAFTATETFNNDCRIINGGTAQEDLVCYLDIGEQDLWFHGLTFQYNAPAGMCEYVQFDPYYYYGFEAGYGASNIVIYADQDADGARTTASVDVDSVNYLPSGAAGSAVYAPEVVVAGNGVIDSCRYDHSYYDDAFPNCCLGKYNLTIAVDDDGDFDYTDSIESATGVAWNTTGTLAECLDGPAIRSDDVDRTEEGYPLAEYTYTELQGINKTFETKAPHDGSLVPLRNGNFSVANYYTPSKHTHDGVGVTGSTVNMPVAIAPVNDRSGTSMPSTQDAYRWRCLDAEGEIIHQIKVYVREWNTKAQYDLFAANGDTSIVLPTTYNPDIGQDSPTFSATDEGTTCDYALFPDGCNDFGDWDNIPGIVGSQEPTSTNRFNFFPCAFDDIGLCYDN